MPRALLSSGVPVRVVASFTSIKRNPDCCSLTVTVNHTYSTCLATTRPAARLNSFTCISRIGKVWNHRRLFPSFSARLPAPSHLSEAGVSPCPSWPHVCRVSQSVWVRASSQRRRSQGRPRSDLTGSETRSAGRARGGGGATALVSCRLEQSGACRHRMDSSLCLATPAMTAPTGEVGVSV